MILKNRNVLIVLAIILLVTLCYNNYFTNQENFGGTCNENYNLVSSNFTKDKFDVSRLVRDCCDKYELKNIGIYNGYKNLIGTTSKFPKSADNIKLTSIQNLYDITKISKEVIEFYNIIYNSDILTTEQKEDLLSLSLNDIKELRLKHKKYNCLNCCESQGYSKEKNLRACKAICDSRYS